MIGKATARTATAVAVAAALVGVTSSAASAAGGFAYGPDPTGGAYAYAYTDTASNGGTYVYGRVYDTAADGKCAHAALRWLHKNGNYYYDYGIWICGDGADGYYETSPRNATLYKKVDLQVFVDNGPTNTYGLATF
jgi:hypothetical protein